VITSTSGLADDQRLMPVGEVVSSSITGLVAETLPQAVSGGLPEPVRPEFGSFLYVDAREDGMQIVAVVHNVVTGPQDSTHKAAALGLSREQLRAEQPHIFSLLKTEIQAATIGFFRGERYFPHLPPQPPQVHDFVFALSNEQLQMASADLDFLRLLSGVSTVPPDELLAASIRQASRARTGNRQYLVEAGQALSQLFRDDYDRLVCVLRKIKPD